MITNDHDWRVEWRVIPEWPGYTLSTQLEVWRMPRKVRGKGTAHASYPLKDLKRRTTAYIYATRGAENASMFRRRRRWRHHQPSHPFDRRRHKPANRRDRTTDNAGPSSHAPLHHPGR